jgi:hypothetical protein
VVNAFDLDLQKKANRQARFFVCAQGSCLVEAALILGRVGDGVDQGANLCAPVKISSPIIELTVTRLSAIQAVKQQHNAVTRQVFGDVVHSITKGQHQATRA